MSTLNSTLNTQHSYHLTQLSIIFITSSLKSLITTHSYHLPYTYKYTPIINTCENHTLITSHSFLHPSSFTTILLPSFLRSFLPSFLPSFLHNHRSPSTGGPESIRRTSVSGAWPHDVVSPRSSW